MGDFGAYYPWVEWLARPAFVPVAQLALSILEGVWQGMMMHPTVFENLKVAFENCIYDLDNHGEGITVTHRADLLDLAVMSRSLELQFALVDQPDITAEVRLAASLGDLAAEILELSEDLLLCQLQLRFRLNMQTSGQACERLSDLLREIWGDEVELELTAVSRYDPTACEMIQEQLLADIRFTRKIGEAQIEDIPELVSHMIQTLYRLESI